MRKDTKWIFKSFRVFFPSASVFLQEYLWIIFLPGILGFFFTKKRKMIFPVLDILKKKSKLKKVFFHSQYSREK